MANQKSERLVRIDQPFFLESVLSLASVYHIINRDNLFFNLVQLNGVASDDPVELVDVFHLSVALFEQQIVDGLDEVVDDQVVTLMVLSQDLTFSLIRNNHRGIAHLLRGLAYAELGNDRDAALDFNTAAAFSEAELESFNKLFGNMPSLLENSKALLSRANAPWNNLLSKDAATILSNLL